MSNIHSLEPLWSEWYVKGRLGKGTYGTVYKIEKQSLGHSYYAAVKHIPIPPEQDDFDLEEDVDPSLAERNQEVLEGLLSEIEINNQLKGHTNIVSYEDHQAIPRPNGAGYDVLIKMELLTSLTGYIRQRPITVGDVVRLGQEICMALEELQKKNIVHRDIKPANIFINSSGHFKLGDFSVSKIMERAQEGMTMRGTPTYMAPEVARSEEGDYRLDLYSLGLVLYRLLNRDRVPFASQTEERPTRDEVVKSNRRRLRGEALPPPALADSRLGEIITRACAFHPEDRWTDARELRRQLTLYEEQTGAEILGQIVLETQDSDRSETTSTRSSTGPAAMPEPDPDDAAKNDETILIKQTHRFPEDNQPPKKIERQNKQQKGKRWFGLVGCGAVAVAVVIFWAVSAGGDQEPVASSSSAARHFTFTPYACYTASGFFSGFAPDFFPDGPPELKQTARWTDGSVEAAVRQTLEMPEGAIPVEALEQITQLHLTQAAASLEDLHYLLGLTSLNLSGLSYTDGILPDTLNGLRELNIAENQFTSLAFVRGMPHLRYLDISGNPISDLSPLADAKELETVIAKNISAEDWSALDHVANVTGRPESEPEPEPEKPASNTGTSGSHTTTKPASKPNKPSAPTESESPAVSGISVSPSRVVMQTGDKRTLSAALSPSGASGSISWSSSNSSVARVSGGTVTAVGAGSATITASCNGYSTSCTVSVNN